MIMVHTTCCSEQLKTNISCFMWGQKVLLRKFYICNWEDGPARISGDGSGVLDVSTFTFALNCISDVSPVAISASMINPPKGLHYIYSCCFICKISHMLSMLLTSANIKVN